MDNNLKPFSFCGGETALYESPITLYQREMEFKFEGDILKAVQRVDVVVDKDELLKALAYDRNQYQKGYRDAVGAVLRDVSYSGKWISIDERLPTREDKYLVAMKNGDSWNVTMRRFKISTGGWHIGRGRWERDTGGVRYWMEKPEAPETPPR